MANLYWDSAGLDVWTDTFAVKTSVQISTRAEFQPRLHQWCDGTTNAEFYIGGCRVCLIDISLQWRSVCVPASRTFDGISIVRGGSKFVDFKGQPCPQIYFPVSIDTQLCPRHEMTGACSITLFCPFIILSFHHSSVSFHYLLYYAHIQLKFGAYM